MKTGTQQSPKAVSFFSLEHLLLILAGVPFPTLQARLLLDLHLGITLTYRFQSPAWGILEGKVVNSLLVTVLWILVSFHDLLAAICFSEFKFSSRSVIILSRFTVSSVGDEGWHVFTPSHLTLEPLI